MTANSDPRKRTRKTGLAPGSLIYVGEPASGVVAVDRYDYSLAGLQRQRGVFGDQLGRAGDAPEIRWLDVEALHDVALIEAIGERYGLHKLTLEDVLNTTQRAKIEDFPEYLFLVMKMVRYAPEKRERLEVEQVSVVLGHRFVITFQATPGDVFDGLRRRLEQPDSRLRRLGADYLAYALADAIVDHDFYVIERIDDEIRLLEESVDDTPDEEMLREIHRLRTVVGEMRRIAWPQRELLAHWLAAEHLCLGDEVRLFLRDVHDHAMQVLEALDAQREVLSSLHDLVLSALNLRASQVMQFLSVFAAIFMPLTFVAGIYGMNFKNMPEIESTPYGYPVVWCVFLAITGVMVGYFRRRGWL